MAHTGKPIGEMVIDLNLDPTQYNNAQKRILSEAKEATGSIDYQWKKLGGRTDAYFDAMEKSFKNSHMKIINTGFQTTETITRSYHLMNAKLAELDKERYAHKYKMIEAEKAAEQAATNEKLSRIEKENNANIQYWLARTKFEKDAFDAATALREKENNANAQYWTSRIASEKKAATEQIATQQSVDKNTRAMGLMQIEALKMNVEHTKQIANEKQKIQDDYWTNMGVRSNAAINAQKQQVLESYAVLSAAAKGNHTELVRLEVAKNEKLKRLNNEMVGTHEQSMAAMTRAILRFYAAYYVLSTAIRGVGGLFMSGVKAIDDMHFAAISVASTITSMQETTGNVAENYKKNLEYANGLIPVLQQIDANSYANLQEIIMMNTQLALHGVLLDSNNNKQVESFTALTNAIKIFTNGQDPMRQMSQEIRAIFTGTIKSSDLVAMQLDSLIKQEGKYKGGLKEVVRLSKEHGDLLERINPYLVGIAAGAADISKTWAAVSSSMQTAWNIIQRGLFADFYKTLTEEGKKANEWLKKNADDIIIKIKEISDAIAFSGKALVGYLAVMGLIAGTVSVWAKMQTVIIGVNIAIAAGTTGLTAWWVIFRDFLGAESVLKITSMGDAFKKFIGVATAAYAGFRFGQYLSDEFEIVRKAGVYMVYGIMSIWEWFIFKMKAGWEDAKSIAQMAKAVFTSDTMADVRKATDVKIKALRDEYEEEKKLRTQWKVERLNNVTDEAIALAKAREKAAKDASAPPKINTGGTGGLSEEELKKIQKEKDAAWNAEVASLKATIEAEQKMIADSYAGMLVSLKTYNSEVDKEWKSEAEIALENYKAIEAMIKDANEGAMQSTKSYYSEEESLLQAKMDLYKDLAGFEDEYRQAQLEWIDKIRKKEIEAGLDVAAANKKAAESTAKIDQAIFEEKTKQIQSGLGEMASMFQSLSGMYDKNSGEYARMQEAANAMIVLQKAVAVVNAVSAVAAAATAPFPAGFVAMASMAAAMGSLLGSIGLSIGGGSGSYGVAAAYGQNTTVLGGANNQGSESISASWELLQDTYDMEDVKLTKIYEEIKDLNSNITGLVTGFIRTGGVDVSGISQGYEVGSMEALYNSQIIDVLESIPVIGSVVGWFNDIVSGAIGSIFGGGTETSVTGGGILFNKSSVSEMLGGGSVGAQGYTGVHVHEEGGWFSSDSDDYYNIYKELDANVSSLMDKIFSNMSRTLTIYAEGFGVDAGNVLKYTFESASVNLLGMDSEEITAALTEYFSKVGDEAVQSLFGNIIGKYQEVGEGLMETASRLLIDKEIVLGVLDKLGESFLVSATQAIELSENIISLAGSLESLTEAADVYYDKFFSDVEKQAHLQQSLTSIMEGINLLLPDTRAGYRYMTEEIQKAMLAGQKWAESAFVTMLQAAEAADQYYSVLEDVNGSMDDFVDNLKSIIQTIDDWLNNLAISDLAPVQSESEWTRQYGEYKTRAGMTEATQADVSDYLNFATQYLEFQKSFGTSGTYQSAYDAVVADVTGMSGGKDVALDLAQKQLDALIAIETNTSLTATGVGAISPESQQAIDTAMAEKAMIEAQAAAAKIAEELRIADEAAAAAAAAAATAATAAAINDYGSAEQNYQSYVLNDLSSGPPMGWGDSHYVLSFEEWLRTWPGHATGLDYVPYDNYPMKAHKGEAVLTSSEAQAWRNSNNKTEEITVQAIFVLDGKVVQQTVTKGLKTNSDLIQSVRMAVA